MIKLKATVRQVSILVLTSWLTVISAYAYSCDYTIGLTVANADARSNYSAVKPGQTVCIAAGTRTQLTLKNFQGTASSLITFVNNGGQVVIKGGTGFGLKVYNSRYLRITGSGSSSFPYGVLVSGSGYSQGVHADHRTSDIELDHIEVSGITAQGLQIHTPADCTGDADYDYNNDGKINTSDSTTEANFTQFNTVVHDNFIHDTGKEGFYLGNNPQGLNKDGVTATGCPTDPQYPQNPRMSGVRVFKNRLERTGWDAMNIKSMKAPYDCFIYSNTVLQDSQAVTAGGGAGEEGGINADDLSGCSIYNNLVKDGNGRGIKLGGAFGKAYNNMIVNAGRAYTSTDIHGSAIWAHRGTSGQTVGIWNNTIISPKSYGVRFEYAPGTGYIQNNIIVNPGSGSSGYVTKCGSCQVTSSNNYMTMNVTDVKFRDPSVGDYSLMSGSPAIDVGMDLSSLGVTADYKNVARPQGPKYDEGALEFVAASAPAVPTGLRIVQ